MGAMGMVMRLVMCQGHWALDQDEATQFAEACTPSSALPMGGGAPGSQPHPQRAPRLLDDLDGLQVSGALEPQHRVHRQLREVVLVPRQDLQQRWQRKPQEQGERHSGVLEAS